MSGAAGGPEFAIHLPSVESLFDELDPRPIAERPLNADVRRRLLDGWDSLRDEWPTTLVLKAPQSERSYTDEEQVRTAIHNDLRTASGPLKVLDPLPRSEVVAARIGIALLFVCITISSVLDRISEDVLVEGLSQGILVLGWVALWRPAERFVTEVVPHSFNRRRFAEFAAIEIEFRWYED